MKRTLHITGENNSSLILDILNNDSEYMKAELALKADWLNATINIEVSIERIKEFAIQLGKALNNRDGSVTLINEEGNMDLTLELETAGKVIVRGILSKNMIEDNQAIFSFESDYHSLTNLNDDINSFLDNL